MSESNTVSTLMAPKWDFTKFDGPQPNYLYMTMIGSLMWAALCTCPNIAFAVNNLMQFNSSYGPEHIARVKQIFHYLKGTIDYGIQYLHSNSGTKAIGYTNVDWAEEKDQKSILGNVFIMSGGAVALGTKKQGSIALSTLVSRTAPGCVTLHTRQPSLTLFRPSSGTIMEALLVTFPKH